MKTVQYILFFSILHRAFGAIFLHKGFSKIFKDNKNARKSFNKILAIPFINTVDLDKIYKKPKEELFGLLSDKERELDDFLDILKGYMEMG
jgi:hypothetical protein